MSTEGDSKEDMDDVPEESLDQALPQDRVKQVTEKFEEVFGHPPHFFLRVPGRVNLIGEHIDYCGYPVLPMAITYCVVIAGRSFPAEHGKGQLRLINLKESYEAFQCAIQDVREILRKREDGRAPDWHLYFLCGLLGAIETFSLENTCESLEICVDGRVPPRAGLSSSSALVCASTLATLLGNKMRLRRREIADLSARSERYIGTAGGGMDQAIAMLASSGSAQFIEFVPKLRATSVQLPPSAKFVVANSLAEANKAANDSYNYRVTECRFATYLLAHSKGLKIESVSKPLDLQIQLKVTQDQLLELVDKELHKEPYSVAELEGILKVDENYLKAKSSLPNTFNRDLKFKLRQRIQHVYSEAGRVELFRAVCKEAADTPNILHQLGKLMNMSHQSLKELYECSHPLLDRLVHLAQNYSYGARLTGAGWGGCMVALVDEHQLDHLLHVLKKEYYEPNFGLEDITPQVFITTPSQGATVLTTSFH